MAKTVLRIDASARQQGSITRDLTNKVIAKLGADKVITRDLAKGLPLLNEEWIGANFTAPGDRSPEQKETLALSDALVAELKEAETVVIGVPIYNFSVPAALKAWIDLISRAGVTFAYSEAGPKGLLEGKRAILVAASGGTGVDTDIDYALRYMRHIMGFIGITDVELVAADRMAVDAEASLTAANDAVERLSA
ncbi:MAG: NAD(P)H-dependent oxidoreductase [Pseudomonadota bacterium]